MICKKCGTQITENSEFCSQCAATLKNETLISPSEGKTSLVGWSTCYQNPEIVAVVKKKNKSFIGYVWALVLVFPLGFLIAGLFLKTMSLVGGLIIGLVLGMLMVVINMIFIKNRRNQIWEGVITEKYQKETAEEESDHIDTDYVLMIEKSDGQKHPMIYQNRREMYDYYNIGDRVRYYVGLATYEKYDKSKDQIIYCNVCLTENPISNERCENCNNLLFK
ncbi:MAG: zinc-ribbon domain-containing protein [Acetobacterium sp.]|nr:zinc-ribbon domain-containing protein [uncultured Acetobacterium sp.]MBU4439398.1 zinc-ribbon domain-containing protein [Bacillota bacterium]MCG2730844.1 zinc-ribbon domain-containing protein [Acetobacterium sp.]